MKISGKKKSGWFPIQDFIQGFFGWGAGTGLRKDRFIEKNMLDKEGKNGGRI